MDAGVEASLVRQCGLAAAAALAIVLAGACGGNTRREDRSASPAPGAAGAAGSGAIIASGGQGTGGTFAGASNAATGGQGNATGEAAQGGAPMGGFGPIAGGTTASAGTTAGASTTSGMGTSGMGASGMGASGMGTSACPLTATAVQSAAVPTVFTVTFATTLSDVVAAEIDFGPAGSPPTMVAPVALAQPNYATYLLGMKQNAGYAYRVKLTSAAGGTCSSTDYSITTGALTGGPTPEVMLMDAAHHEAGFVVQSINQGDEGRAFILDGDGDMVWLSPSGLLMNDLSRAHFSWDGRRIYIVRANPLNQGGSITSMALDGTDVQTLPNTAAAHHDLAATPGGIAILRWNGPDTSASTEVVEVGDDGSEKTVLADVTSVYNSSAVHTNSIHYYDRDQSYTIGDTDPSLYVKVSRSGELVWQFGGQDPKDPSKDFGGVTTWQANHGHHFAADGTFAFFNNGPGFGVTTMGAVVVYKLDEATLTATPVTSFTGINSWILGDVQVLENGNFLVTASLSGFITELTPAGDTVMTISGLGQLGYSEFRRSLYGPPQY
jgi:hypothetical protein